MLPIVYYGSQHPHLLPRIWANQLRSAQKLMVLKYKISKLLERRAFGQVQGASEARTELYNNTVREDWSLQQRNWPNLKGPYRQAEAGGGRASYNNGFTLVEALVALVILTVALGPALVLSSNISSTASVIQNNLIASNLSQEGVEVIRALRDANWFNGLPFDAGLTDGIYRIEWTSNALIALGSNPPLKKQTGIYNYASGTDTIFRRTVTITKINSEELRIISDVTWTERGNRARSVKAESHLFDWK